MQQSQGELFDKRLVVAVVAQEYSTGICHSDCTNGRSWGATLTAESWRPQRVGALHAGDYQHHDGRTGAPTQTCSHEADFCAALAQKQASAGYGLAQAG
ncbi:MAG: hypothetical protein ACK5QX_06355 [bacterium]